MSDFQCKFYLLDGAETLECKDGNAEYAIKLADRPFPDSLLSFVYYDINSWEPRFHEAERTLMAFYQTRDTTCLKPVQKLLDEFKNGHPYFFYLWLDWSNRLKQATPDCKNPTKLLPHKELAHVPSNLATMQQQILRLFQTVLDASITDVDFSIRVQAYEQAPSLQKFDFQPMKISFDFINEKQRAELQRIDAAKRHKEQQVELAEQELKQVKSEIRTDKLKSVATDAATAIASGVGSLFGSGKLKELEHNNAELQQEIVKRDKSIDDLKVQMQHMQEQHGKQIRNLQGIHNQELEIKDKEISRLNTILEKAFNWFPLLKEMLRMERLCYAIGFTKDMINSLLAKKEAIRCNGRIYSEEHRRKFDIKNDIFKVEKSSVDNNKLVLTINRQPIGEWFKEQWEKLWQGLRQSAEEPRKNRGFKL